MLLPLLLAQATATPDLKIPALSSPRFTLAPGTKTACERGGPVGSWVSDADYPAAARRSNMQGLVSFTLEISEKGCPVACTVDNSSGWELLDTHTCQLMLVRARFKPAKNGGLPITAKWSGKFNWNMK
ncbi:energy transducer TonB [Sphingomonas sp. SUN039]|uniref:energy transducer TonB n=1 Tax=Sphingomonas sp. SUN039 TaxID=2937787 RepID=UPI0038D4B553